jgi:hypothetical protein
MVAAVIFLFPGCACGILHDGSKRESLHDATVLSIVILHQDESWC